MTQATEPQTAAPLPGAPVPTLTTPLSPDQIIKCLDAAARRGKLAGFQPRPAPDLFEVEAYSEPFDHALIATLQGQRLAFRTHMLRRKPWIFAVVIAFSIWPGLPLTHSMLLTWFSWYHLSQPLTAAWYLPLTVLPLPWMLRKWLKKSRDEAAQAATEQVQRIKELLDAAG